jgi:hypothetical protein
MKNNQIPKSTVYKNIKKILIQLAMDDKLPLDMNGFDTSVLEPAIEPLLEAIGSAISDNEYYIEALNNFDNEAFNEDNFEATISVCERALKFKTKDIQL